MFHYDHEYSNVAFYVDVCACVCSHDDDGDDETHEKVEERSDDGTVEILLFRCILYYLNDALR